VQSWISGQQNDSNGSRCRSWSADKFSEGIRPEEEEGDADILHLLQRQNI
ncbi:hypothetical protein Tco_0120431, partial [Tanacetum coccineum]